MPRKQLTKENILEATLSLIEVKGSSHALNFREIARQLNCAHQSLYNYYESYGELQQAALQAMAHRIRTTLVYKGDMVDFVLQLVDFVIQHPSWYRFLWMDHVEMKISEALLDQPRPERLLIQPFRVSEGLGMSEEQATIFLQMSHSYVHGELVQYLAGRSRYNDPKSLKEGIANRVTAMMNWALLAAEKDQIHIKQELKEE